MRALPVDGALIALSTRQGAPAVGYATDERFRDLDDAQVTAGEGPAIDAFAKGLPVLADDLGSTAAGRRWPAFAPTARSAGVNALYALPLRIGVIRLGVFSLYRFTDGSLDERELGVALNLADAAAVVMLGQFDGDTPVLDGASAHAWANGNGTPDGARLAAVSADGDHAADELYRATVHQASGMIMVQLGIPIDEALARMRAYCYAEDLSLVDVARAVVARSLRLER